ncbi:MAG: cobalt ECF transporter T component CbiQ, partial [Ilumatobacteraceae bacterium]
MGAGAHRHLVLHHEGRLHRLPAQCKVAATLLFVIAVVVTPREQVWAFVAYGVLVAVVASIGSVPLRHVARRLVIEVPFLLFAVFLPIVGRGPRVDVLWFTLSEEGLWAAWNIVAKGTIGVAASIVLASTTSVPQLLAGLERLRVPRVMVSIAGFMVRYGDVVADEVRRMRIARESRLGRGGRLGQVRALATTAGALFVRSYERGERVYLAMESRGYAGSMPVRGVAASAQAWV